MLQPDTLLDDPIRNSALKTIGFLASSSRSGAQPPAVKRRLCEAHVRMIREGVLYTGRSIEPKASRQTAALHHISDMLSTGALDAVSDREAVQRVIQWADGWPEAERIAGSGAIRRLAACARAIPQRESKQAPKSRRTDYRWHDVWIKAWPVSAAAGREQLAERTLLWLEKKDQRQGGWPSIWRTMWLEYNGGGVEGVRLRTAAERWLGTTSVEHPRWHIIFRDLWVLHVTERDTARLRTLGQSAIATSASFPGREMVRSLLERQCQDVGGGAAAHSGPNRQAAD
jgi:hypothetical protein